MFEGVQDQLHQFIASSRTSLPIPLTFPLHGNSTTTFPTFYHHSSNQQSHLLPPLHHPSPPTHKNHERERQEQGNNHHHHNNNNNTNLLISTNLVLERERSVSEPMDPWSNDEVLALLRIRSSLENWYPDFTWEHVSRKLAEVGFIKRSAEKCKEKFEEESRYFNFTSINNTFNNHTTTTTNKQNYRFFSELEELCHGESSTDNNNNNNNNIDHRHIVEKTIVEENPNGEEEEQQDKNHHNVEEEKVLKSNKSKKRKRRERHENKFEMLKCFCEGVVKKIMDQQEELHNKLLEDMVKRDEEIIAKEEAWKKEEMSRIEKEIEIRANEQAIVGDRQATIFEFLKKFNFEDFQGNQHCFLNLKVPQNPNLETQNNPKIPTPLDETLAPQNPNSTFSPNISKIPNSSNLAIDAQSPNSLKVPNSSSLALDAQNSNSLNTQIVSRLPNSSTLALDAQNPNSPNTQNDPSSKVISNSTHETPQKPSFVAPPPPPPPPNNEEDQDHHHGKRWPRDEVLALINLRCNFYNNNNNNGEDHKEGSTPSSTTTTTTSNKSAPLWERISQGMFGLGYKRSAKRCKEKWENINKYFRKTKDNVNKKRSSNSRTCPYYHQLSNLYNQGTLVAPPQPPPPPPTISENRSSSPENHPNSPDYRPPEFSQVVSTSNTNNMHGGGCDGQKSMIQAPTFDFEF